MTGVKPSYSSTSKVSAATQQSGRGVAGLLGELNETEAGYANKDRRATKAVGETQAMGCTVCYGNSSSVWAGLSSLKN
ncbi:MAG: hypothetical protein FWB81_06780 [Cystobacterineae bacterium]|nr:hypothetical protein [Cystobacterineae bacterium]